MKFFIWILCIFLVFGFIPNTYGQNQVFRDWKFSSESDAFTDQKSSAVLPSVRGLAKYYKDPNAKLLFLF